MKCITCICLLLGAKNIKLFLHLEKDINLTKTLIEKTTISSFISPSPNEELKIIDRYYISLLGRSLERIVDNLILLDQTSSHFQTLKKPIETMIQLLEPVSKSFQSLSIKAILHTVQNLLVICDILEKSQDYNEKRIGERLEKISEILMDWAITEEIYYQ